MLDSAQKDRVKSLRDYGIKHSTLLEACTNNEIAKILRKLLIMGMAQATQRNMKRVSGIKRVITKVPAPLVMNMESS